MCGWHMECKMGTPSLAWHVHPMVAVVWWFLQVLGVTAPEERSGWEETLLVVMSAGWVAKLEAVDVDFPSKNGPIELTKKASES